MEELLSEVGRFCPNEDCEDYGKTTGNDVIRFGTTPKGIQRYRCHTCGRTFSQTRGTILFNLKKPAKDVLECLALLAEGVRISSISRTKGFKEDTILDWARKAAAHAQELEELLLQEHRLSQVQIDALWAFVKNKGKKKTTKRRKRPVSSGEVQ